MEPYESAGGAAGPSGPRATFGVRLVALLIDGVLLTLGGVLLAAVLGDALGNIVGLVAGVAYYAYLEGSPSGQTVGKRVMNIRVIDPVTGGPLGLQRALLRYVGRVISTLPCALGYLWMLWDRERQTWHDKIATSVVVPTSAYPVTSWPG